MDNQRVLLYAALGFILLILWQNWQIQSNPQLAVQATQSDAVNPAAADVAAGAPAASVPGTPQAPGTAIQPAGQKIRVETDLLVAEIDTRGGTLTHVALKDYPVAVDKPDEPFVLMSDEPAKFFVAQSGLQSAGGNAPTHQAMFQAEADNYVMADGQNELRIPLTWQGEDGISVTKTLVFKRDSYEVQVEQALQNGSGEPVVVNQYRQLQRKEVTDDEKQSFIYTFIGGVVSTADEPYTKVDFGDFEESDLNQTVTGGWVAMMQHYFVGAVIPQEDQANTFYTKALSFPKRYIIGMYSDSRTVNAGDATEFVSEFYVGPKDQERLEAAAHNLKLTVDFGWLTVLANPIFWLLKKIHSFVGNWGWSIILLTMLIKGMFYKLSEASYKSMARMRKLQPKMQALKEKYGDDRQKIGEATMKLYKEEKVNPLGGCLPMLVQIPVFIALYWVLLESVELRQAPWILWIKDMSIRDPYFILPVIMGITMFTQQKLNPAPIDPIQQKMFTFLPVVFTVFFAFFPAGLVLYWVVNNSLSILQQWYITRHVIGTD
ncbi:membrane protein insertase YidC [Granulosicoccaceae sp. 1_MG-2023]|nr:membrane protein insertase YidC [Granulosicoccaceae sp. 1_MG-2023]